MVDDDSSGKKEVVGTIAFADLLIKNTNIYLPTVLEILKNLPVFGGDRDAFRERFKNVFGMKAEDIMNPNPVEGSSADPAQQAIKFFIENPSLNILVVVNPAGNKIEGAVSRQAALNFFYQYGSEISAAPGSSGWQSPQEKAKTEKISREMREFGEFSLVTKTRTRHWLLWSAVFVVAGIVITLFFILRVVLR